MDPFAKKMFLGSVAFGVAILLMAGVLTVVYLHQHPRCSDQVISETPSPDQKVTATVLMRRCGDESPFFVHVNLRPAGAPIRLGFFSGRAEEGEIFLAEQDSYETPPLLEWVSPQRLEIRCQRCRFRSVAKREARLGAISIDYQID